MCAWPYLSVLSTLQYQLNSVYESFYIGEMKNALVNDLCYLSIEYCLENVYISHLYCVTVNHWDTWVKHAFNGSRNMINRVRKVHIFCKDNFNHCVGPSIFSDQWPICRHQVTTQSITNIYSLYLISHIYSNSVFFINRLNWVSLRHGNCIEITTPSQYIKTFFSGKWIPIIKMRRS